MALTVEETRDGMEGPGLRAVSPSGPGAGAARRSWDTSSLGLGELIEVIQRAAQDLAGRLRAPDLTEQLEPAARDTQVSPTQTSDAAPSEGPSPVTLTTVQSGVARLARVVELAQTAVAGVTDRVLQDPQARHRLLGLSTGKTGFRNAAEFLEQTQQTPRRDTHARVDRAAQHLAPPVPGPDTGPQPPVLSEVTGALCDASVDPSVVDAITRALTAARAAAHRVGADRALVERLIAAGQVRLMGRARHAAPSAMVQACRRWRREFDQLIAESGTDPSPAQVNQGRSAVFLREENGLYLWQLWLTQAQHEIIQTVTSAGTNPRAPQRHAAPDTPGEHQQDGQTGQAADHPDAPDTAGGIHPGMLRAEERGRQQVDAIISALTAALRLTESDVLSTTGGARPHVMVHIDYQTLAGQLAAHPDLPPPPPVPETLAEQHPPGNLRAPVVSAGTFTGPIDPRVIRAWACDADLIPVVLGGQGEVLDIGRAQRVFPPGIRKAIIARDRGCAAPGCSIPAPWCQIHHIRYWTRHHGSTSADNGVLLCSHHHQALHHDQLTVQMTDGVPRVHHTSGSSSAQARPDTSAGSALPDSRPVHPRNLHWHDR